ncbi:uncharacterized protein LOC119562716 [Drosophila subpulchrella]|uniref:uncharacterized protein LOC119562714 n=1 Tax=Drosophila subpulchrella TaxID=1486046 RepID=UPI0018A17FC1|nr:uncharacterized protein LOC119562714 [Drosophila subpulchrella]XP_037731833.1 uncharacterized protein LOC119562715 [Drosophila subpulchrella]XP_037731834.1 uncharacterized protein LOC119562716 [Drosophila subpulchrella]
MMAAHQPSGGSSPGQRWSTARPTRTSHRINGRGVPEPVISSDSDVELVEDPRVEQRRCHAESVAAATLEFRRKCEARRRSEERLMKEMEESPEWQAQLRAAEEEEQQLWRQQTVVWTWPEGPVEETAATEEPRIWEESGPRVSPLDPRTRGRPEQWAPPTPSTGPTTPRTGPSTPMPTGSATVTAEPLERGPWVWPEPVENGRPPLKRQHSAPEVSEVVARPKLSRTVSAPEGQRWQEIAEHEWPEGIAETPVVKKARILGGRRSVRVWREGRAFRVRLGLAGTRVFEERPK